MKIFPSRANMVSFCMIDTRHRLPYMKKTPAVRRRPYNMHDDARFPADDGIQDFPSHREQHT